MNGESSASPSVPKWGYDQERWPRLLQKPLFAAQIRTRPEDFCVEEVPAYLPCGSGEHLFVKLEKRSLATDSVVRELARQVGVSTFDVGTAGLKDRYALTCQWVSLPVRAEQRLRDFHLEGVSILEVSRHGNKLRTGHLQGNNFRIRLRGLDPGAREDIVARAAELSRRGMPNYFGPQRFGSRGENLRDGLKLLGQGGKFRRGRDLRFKLSAVQSWLFNAVLARRLEAGLLERALAGDLLVFDRSSKFFACTEPEQDQPRLDRLEVHPTGPLFGPRMPRPQGEPDRLEREVLLESGLDEAAFGKFAKLTSGGRRPLRAATGEIRSSDEEGDLVLEFFLPPGCYATCLLRELVDWKEAVGAE